MATSINYSSTASGGKTLSKSVTAINPNIDNAVAKTFTQKLNALTTNTLSTINRVDKTEIDPNITYYNVKLIFNVVDGQHITFDNTTNTLTIDAANIQQGEHEMVTLSMDLDTASQAHITNPIRIIDWTFGNNPDLAIYADATNRLGIDFIKQKNTSDTVTLTLAGGSFVAGSTTYYYSPVTITVIINA